MSLPLKYLSLPLGALYKAKHIWDGVIEKIERRFARWKQCICLRVVGLPLSRASYPTYLHILYPSFLSFRVLPNVLELQHGFLWGGIGKEYKYHIVSWLKVCTLISEGGLGIRSLLKFNHALLGKWLGRYGLETEA